MEPSTKRRKLNTAPDPQTTRTRSNKSVPAAQSGHDRSLRTTPKINALSDRATSPVTQELEVPSTATHKIAHQANEHKTRTTEVDEGHSEDGEEIVVRSSGRARRPTAKLAEDNSQPESRASTPRPANRSKPAKAAAAKGRQLEIDEHENIRVQSAGRISAARKKRSEDGPLDKENITPPGTTASTRAPDPRTAQAPPAERSVEARKAASKISPESQSTETQHIIEDQEITAPSQLAETGRNASATLQPVVLKAVREEVTARAVGRNPIPLFDRHEELTKVTSLIKQAVEAGESNSMLLIGSRGTGKTTLINQVLRAQQESTPDDFLVVRLNGFIHTDDKLALRDTWRQLGREMEIDEAETATRSYADTMSMLLALLSHPLELGQKTSPGHTTKSVIFILDEFDLFTTHPRQTLLYNLFDIAQSRKAPIAVLGVTTRIDVVEALEKRVKSRFSHRYVHLAPSTSLTAFVNVCKATLSLKTDSNAWNTTIAALFDNEEYLVHIRKIYYRSKAIPDFLTIMQVPLALLPTNASLSTEEVIEHFLSTISTSVLGPDSKLDILPSLSTLQLALLICAARQNAIYAADNVSFNLAYEEYKAIAGKAKLQATASGALGGASRVWSKDVAKDAWTDLVEYGLIIEDGRNISRVDIALEELAESGIDLGQWSRWTKEI